MKTLRLILLGLAAFGLCSTVAAAELDEDFESFSPGTEMHGQGNWEGWDNTASAGAPVSDAYAFSGSNSLEIPGSADLVYKFDIQGGQWVYKTMMYIPSGGSGTTWFIMLNSYPDAKDWSVQTQFNLASGAITSSYAGGTYSIIYDQWVELRMMIDLDNNTVDEYYNGELLYSHTWDDDGTPEIGCVDLYGAGASSVYYDDILVQTLLDYEAAAANPSPADGAADVERDPVLSWTAGSYAVTHDVYFGDAYDAVAAATRTSPMDVLVSQGQSTTTYAVDGPLEFGQDYYWRIDEVRQDGTIDAGNVWTFQAEPFSYTIENVVATSNGALLEGQGPENTVNGSGLDENGQHSADTADMWLADFGDEPLYIQFEFPRVYKMYEMHVWNHNFIFEMALGFGAKDVTVEYSTDGDEWIALEDAVFAQATGQTTYTPNTTVEFGGVAATAVRLTINSNFGGGTQVGLSEVRFSYTPGHARYPEPTDEATDIDVKTALSWRPGRDAVSHDVYLGTDPNALESVATTTDDTYDQAALNLDTTYYWQVNEVNEADAVSVWEGDLWSFSTQEYIVLDDFESYIDDAEAGDVVWEIWIDGLVEFGGDPANGGSQVGHAVSPFAEQAIVRSGSQSMPLYFDNASASAISEADRTLSPAQDWSANGIKSLSLWFAGAEGNTGELYVKINEIKVVYDGEATDIASSGWKTWNIDLSTVGNVSNVTTLSVGVQGTGSGVVYIDDIRLYGKTPEFIVPTEPDAANLAGLWSFEGNANDSSGNGRNGTLNGSPTYVSGAEGQAINFNGSTDYVVVGAVGISGAAPRTISGWAKPDTLTIPDWCNIFGFTASTGAGNLSFDMNKRGGQNQYCIHVYGWERNIMEIDLEWHHLAATYDGTTIAWYGDGRFVGSEDREIDTEDIVQMGKRAHSEVMWPGSVDEVAIYSTALSPEEIASLAGKKQPMHKPF